MKLEDISQVVVIQTPCLNVLAHLYMASRCSDAVTHVRDHSGPREFSDTISRASILEPLV